MTQRLWRLYGNDEASTVARRILEAVTQRSYPSLFISGYKLTKKEEETVEAIALRLERHEPLQYVLGEVTFGSLTLFIAPGALIPRPETEEMCTMIQERGLLSPAKTAIDIGTGSGAIALFLAHHNTALHVDAIDVSPDALQIAEHNVLHHQLQHRIHLHQLDILEESFRPPHDSYDLIISNPPYVLNRERSGMSRHVLDYEPETALFVPDSDPLLFYRTILHRLLPFLAPGGWIVYELNALTAIDCVDLCRGMGLETQLVQDMQGRDRFIFGQKK